jgi:hypothetical protein
VSFITSWWDRRKAAGLVDRAIAEGTLASLDERVADLNEALRLYRANEDQAGQARALYRLGQLTAKTTTPAELKARFEEAHALAKAVGDRALASAIYGELQSPYLERGGTDWEGVCQWMTAVA